MSSLEAIRAKLEAEEAYENSAKIGLNLVAALEAVLSHASAEVEDYRDRRGSMIEYDQMEAAGRADYAGELSQRITEALA